MKQRVLFLCTGNSARSQIAEGLLRHHGGDRFEASSAGAEPRGINPLTVKVMEEIGLDISSQRSKSVKEFLEQRFDYVITLCQEAQEACPFFTGKYEKLHWDLKDPAQAKGTEEEKLTAFRIARNQIKAKILDFLNIPRDEASLKCPYCGFIQEVRIPASSCLAIYECQSCNKIITHTRESCCVICAYSDKSCKS